MAGEKIGRNDPCPCGSGRKYKQCCLGRSRLAADEMEAIKGALQESLAGGDFGSIEELQAEADRFMAGYNSAPVPGFHGLSREQVHRCLYFPFESPELATFPDPLVVEPQAPVITLFSALVDGIGEAGVKTTARGNLPRKLCREAAVAYWGEEQHRKRTEHVRINREDDFYDLHALRLVAEMAGLIRKYRGRFVLTRKCRDTMQRSGMAGIYPQLFRTFAAQFNWGYGDGHQDLPFIQHTFLFSLYLLYRYGSEERPVRFYEQAFLQAFPALLDEVEPRLYSSVEDIARRCYSWRTFDRFAGFFGLAHIRKGGGLLSDEKDTVAKTPLLEYVVSFSSAIES